MRIEGGGERERRDMRIEGGGERERRERGLKEEGYED